MKIFIPVNEIAGLESTLCGHFGSAPHFLTVDTVSKAVRTVENPRQQQQQQQQQLQQVQEPHQHRHQHRHGGCSPLAALKGEAVDAVLVRGIGGGALANLRAAGVTVYRASGSTVAAAIAALEAGTLQEVAPEKACQGHHDHQGVAGEGHQHRHGCH